MTEFKDFISTTGEAHGDMATELQESYFAKSLRTFDSLPREAVEIIDRTIVETAPLTMVGIPDLQTGIDQNLVMRIDGLAAVHYTMQGAVTTGEAKLAMSPAVRKDHAGLRFYERTYPLPVIFENYQVNKRELASTTRVTEGFNRLAVLAQAATRAVTQKAEDLLFNGNVMIEGKYIYGYTEFPDRQLYTITDWTTATGQEIVEDCNKMLQQVIDARHYGPCILYIPPEYSEPLRRDYIDTVVSETILARIYALNTVPSSGIANRLAAQQMTTIAAVRVAPYLDPGEVVLVEMRDTTINLIEGLALQNIELRQSPDPWEQRYAVVAMWVPAPTTQELMDGTKLCGIVHGTIPAPVKEESDKKVGRPAAKKTPKKA
jgi:hypothetical protein